MVLKISNDEKGAIRWRVATNEDGDHNVIAGANAHESQRDVDREITSIQTFFTKRHLEAFSMSDLVVVPLEKLSEDHTTFLLSLLKEFSDRTGKQVGWTDINNALPESFQQLAANANLPRRNITASPETARIDELEREVARVHLLKGYLEGLQDQPNELENLSSVDLLKEISRRLI